MRRKMDPDRCNRERKLRPALTEEARESQMIALAVDLVEERLLNGTASAQETTHYLKLASSKHKLELEKLREENRLLQAKTESIQSAKRVEELYAEAINAMRRYTGNTSRCEDEDDYDDT